MDKGKGVRAYSTEEYKIKKINYQRNGIAGEGFWSIEFITKENKKRLIGIINDNDLRKKDGYTRFYVVNPKNIFQGWRGDNFGAELVPIIREYEKDLLKKKTD